MHVIRLRHPWEKHHVGSERKLRVDIPESIDSSPPTQATIQYRRPFNRPTGLDADDQVHLRVTGWSGRLDFITVNGTPIRTGQDSVFANIRDQLASRNIIEMQLSSTTDQSPALTGEVTIEID